MQFAQSVILWPGGWLEGGLEGWFGVENWPCLVYFGTRETFYPPSGSQRSGRKTQRSAATPPYVYRFCTDYVGKTSSLICLLCGTLKIGRKQE